MIVSYKYIFVAMCNILMKVKKCYQSVKFLCYLDKNYLQLIAFAICKDMMQNDLMLLAKLFTVRRFSLCSLCTYMSNYTV